MNSAPPGTKKTALCRYFISTGSCVYGDDCQFLHQNPGVGFQKPYSNGPHPPTENQGVDITICILYTINHVLKNESM